jgi:hypothetical protein
MLKYLWVVMLFTCVALGSAQDYSISSTSTSCSAGCGQIVTKNTKTITRKITFYRQYYSLACLCYKSIKLSGPYTSSSSSCGCTIPTQVIRAKVGEISCPTASYKQPLSWTEEIAMQLQQWMSVMPPNFLYQRIT